MISIVVLVIVLALIAVRQIGRFRLRIWQIMLGGALAVLVAGEISPADGFRAVNPDVMLFLFGVFITGRALEESGYLEHISSRLFSRCGSAHTLVLALLFSLGLLSAVMMNDTLAIIGTGLVMGLGARTGISRRLLLMAVAFAVTTGSVMSPVGNPQNLLIATEGQVQSPFVVFLQYLALPTVVNLLAAYGILWLVYRKDFRTPVPALKPAAVTDPALARLAKTSLIVLVTLIGARMVFSWAAPELEFRLSYIALASALPVVLFSPRRLRVVRGIDWSTLVFFAAMFVLMQSVWNTGYFQSLIESSGIDPGAGLIIFPASILLSQLVSNVPLVAMYLPVLADSGAGTLELMILAAGSTIAGNLTIIGAASNVIIIQKAEKEGGATLTFLEFLKSGVPLTIVNAAVYGLFLWVLS